MEKKSFDYDVRLWDKKGNRYYETVELTEGQNFFMIFYNLMKKYNCNKFHASVMNYKEQTNYMPSPFRWSYYN